MSVSISLKDVRLERHGGAFVLDVPRLSIDGGDHVAITGPSGSGKTTLLHLIAGLFHPDTGRIQVEETEVLSLREGARRALRRSRMGIVFQTSALIPYLTILENVLLTPRLMNPFGSVSTHRGRALQLLEQAGLQHLSRRFPAQLSAGEQQRVALCRALLPRPAIILADEPTANLDKDSANIVATLMLQESRTSGSTVLCVSHDDTLLQQFTRRHQMRGGALLS